MEPQLRLPVTIVRGGTSKAIFVRSEDLTVEAGPARDALVRSLFGSPDRRQIDGLGGADLLTSKFAIIGPPSRPDADVDYTFAQVGIEVPTVAWDLNCGNISAAVGPYAIEEGFVRPREPMTTVRIHNTNTSKIIVADVPVENGAVAVDGDYEIDGVPGTGARIMLDYSGSAGARSGRLLPTGNPIDRVEVEGFGPLEVSVVDAANPGVFIDARSIGLRGTEDPVEVQADEQLMGLLERIRAAGAVAGGMSPSLTAVLTECPTTPFVAFVARSAEWVDFRTRERRPAETADFVARMALMQLMHKAYAGTGTICTGVAAMIPGTVVNKVCDPGALSSGQVRIGHPSGFITVDVALQTTDAGPALRRAAFGRTARRLLDGVAYLRRPSLPVGAAEGLREPAVARR
jgi:2-methylaconitate cis-trans-isomerase PrpF